MRSVDEFVRGLAGIREDDFTLTRVADYVLENRVDAASLQPYLFYQPTHYTRNLIYKCGLFEVIAVCWDVGHASPIHNHQGQNCWMAVPIGRLEVQNYDLLRSDDRGFCELREAERLSMDPEHPSSVQPDKPIHAVLNPPSHGQRATSLHVYSRPYDRCLVYSLENKSYSEIPLFYDSEYGETTPAPLRATPAPAPGSSGSR